MTVIHIFPDSLTSYQKTNESFAIDKTVNKDNVDNKIQSVQSEINQTSEDLKSNSEQFVNGQLDSNTLKREVGKLVDLHTQLIYYVNLKNNQ